ncbi:MAG TPA: hypothetical protein VGH65_00610 [Verrucomicrobiaceae bacterium]|jgi:hypothetical protein
MPDDTRPKQPFLSWPVIILILALVGGVGWWLSERSSAPLSESPAPKSVPPPMPPPAPKAAAKSPTQPEIATAVTPAPAPLPREDELKIHNWLTGFDDTNETAAAILAGWKNLSEPGKTAAAPHLLNLVPDERFEDLAKILLDPSSNTDVKDILFAGILNRDNALKWPLIVRVMQQKNNPHSQDARTMLTVVLGKDYGDDWPQWQKEVQARLLNENPP